MSKPDDIPQNEWDAAFAEMDCHCSEAMMGDDGLQQAVHTAIARAIMAAKAEERELWAGRVAMLEQKLGLNGHEEIQETFGLDRAKAKLLKALIENDVLTRDGALFALTGGRAVDPKILDVQLCGLRKKIEPFGYRIKTIRCSGFQLVGPELAIGEAA